MCDFAKEMYFDVKAPVNKSTRDRTPLNLLKSAGLKIVASGTSNTIFLPSDPNGLCDRLKLLPQENQTGNISDLINEETVAIVDKLFGNKCISKRKHKQIKCNLLHTTKM